MSEAGLIVWGNTGRISGLTWEGHEFLANAKNEKLWKEFVKRAAEKGGSFSFAVAQLWVSPRNVRKYTVGANL